MESNRQAGVELNALVHLKLFGKSARPEWCPQYSTDWNSMRLVVEEMQRRGYTISLYWSTGRDESEGWHCSFTSGVGMECKHYAVYAGSAPHGACLAALKALEADTNE